jgi:hypothetical protein
MGVLQLFDADETTVLFDSNRERRDRTSPVRSGGVRHRREPAADPSGAIGRPKGGIR